MKVIVQRVSSARVIVDGQEISSVGRGILALVGIKRGDTEKDVDFMARKLLALRLFEDDTQKRWAKSISDLGLEILCVSQFTLYHTMKGNKPDFRQAMGPEESKLLYNKLIMKLKNIYNPELVKDGVFGAHMHVSLVNDGPVTLELESKNDKNTSENAEGEDDGCTAH